MYEPRRGPALTLAECGAGAGRELSPGEAIGRRYREGGARALRHRHVGRCRIGPGGAGAARALGLIREKYSGDVSTRFGPTLAAEHLASEDGLDGRSRDAAPVDAGGGVMESAAAPIPYRQRRERKAHFGELVQLDGSMHPWLEARGPRAAHDVSG